MDLPIRTKLTWLIPLLFATNLALVATSASAASRVVGRTADAAGRWVRSQPALTRGLFRRAVHTNTHGSGSGTDLDYLRKWSSYIQKNSSIAYRNARMAAEKLRGSEAYKKFIKTKAYKRVNGEVQSLKSKVYKKFNNSRYKQDKKL